MAAAIRDFKGVEHRLETVATVNGVEFVNDSKATNVDSAVKALEAFDVFDTSGVSEANIILIVGGRGKETPLEPLVQAMRGRVRQVLSLGEAAEKLERAIGAVVPTRRVRSIAGAVEVAIELGRSGDVVLLAPACSSFDMYASYEERGRDFKNAVRSHMRVKVSDK